MDKTLANLSLQFSASYKCTDESLKCYNNSLAHAILADYGIDVYSVGNCSERNNHNCTSLEQIHGQPIAKIVALAVASTCRINITAGTEIGHPNESTQ